MLITAVDGPASGMGAAHRCGALAPVVGDAAELQRRLPKAWIVRD